MKNDNLKKILNNIIIESAVLKKIKKFKAENEKNPPFGREIRGITRQEIDILEGNANRSSDWGKIKVTVDFVPSFIIGNTFHGKCVLGRQTGKDIFIDENITLPSGIYRSAIKDSVIGNECLIHETGLICNYMVMHDSAISRVDFLYASGRQKFGNGIEIPIGIETGGREVLSFAELSIALAEAAAMNRRDNDFTDYYKDAVTEYINEISLPHGVIESKSIITGSKKIINTYIGGFVKIDGAQFISNSTLLGCEGEVTEASHGAVIKDSCLQWGSHVTSMGIVEGSVITEHSGVERHGKVISSIIGPNTNIAEGEVTSSLIGPFVGFHHQSMIIAALWPSGKGNVGYGANIGSNHTSKAPDQEILCGEGLFFGLGVNIKYPSNFLESPYSIIATAVETLPQRVRFPFSLINKPGKCMGELSPAFNEIFPGWALYNNIYAVLRNEEKYRERNRARRSDFDFEVLRPDIIDMMIDARNRLANPEKSNAIYTGDSLHGLGKNYMTEKSRTKGIEAYNFFIEYYALNGLFRELAGRGDSIQGFVWESIYEGKLGGPRWVHERRVLQQEGYAGKPVKKNLERLMEIFRLIPIYAMESKEKDDIRGRKIIDDYDHCHLKAEDDPFIERTRKKCGESIREIAGIINKL